MIPRQFSESDIKRYLELADELSRHMIEGKYPGDSGFRKTMLAGMEIYRKQLEMLLQPAFMTEEEV